MSNTSSTLEEIGVEIIDGDRGANYPNESEFLNEGYCLFLSAKNVTKNGFRFDDLTFITKNKDDKLSKGKLIRNDIIITSRGTIGNSAFYNKKIPFPNIRINSGMLILRLINENYCHEYIYQLLRSQLFDCQVKNAAYGSAQHQLNVPIVKNLSFNFPCLPQQRKIAQILTTVDNLIEKTETLIAKYESIKQGMMHDLFTRGVDENGQLRPPVDEAPELYKDSELGWIPRNWTAGPLIDFFTLQRGFDITQDQQNEGNIPVISSSGVTSFHSEYMCKGPGVVIGRKGKLGDAYYVEGPYWPHDTSLWVKDFHDNLPKFGSYFLRYLKLERFDAATSVPTLNRNFIHPMNVALPLLAEQKKIVNILECFKRRVIKELDYLSKLTLSKVGLMQDLLTGKVRVKIKKKMS